MRGRRNTYSQVSVDARITCSTCEILVLTIGYMLMCLGVSVLLSKSEINHIYLCTFVGHE